MYILSYENLNRNANITFIFSRNCFTVWKDNFMQCDNRATRLLTLKIPICALSLYPAQSGTSTTPVYHDMHISCYRRTINRQTLLAYAW